MPEMTHTPAQSSWIFSDPAGAAPLVLDPCGGHRVGVGCPAIYDISSPAPLRVRPDAGLLEV